MMRTQLHVAFLAAAFAAFVTGCQSTKEMPNIAGASGTEPVAILRMIQGDDKAFLTADRHLINSGTPAFSSLDPLKADFTKESVVVISLGEDLTGAKLTITGVQRQGNKLFVQGKVTPGTLSGSQSCPFAAIVISKFEGTVHPEID